MKKYFVSYCYKSRTRLGFGNCIKTSLNKNLTLLELKSWEEELSIVAGMKLRDDVKIINFQEIKS